MITYPNARDSHGNDVNIKEVTSSMRKSTQFFCWGCGRRMVAVLNGDKEKHFRHYEECDCNGESYIHNRGKAAFKETFEKNTSFFVEIKGVSVCSNRYECPLCKSDRCTKPKTYRYDLKRYYDTAELEVYIKELKVQPDVLLKSSKFPERKLFIEIYHTSACSKEKIDTKERIIEIPVNSERDIRMIQGGVIKESDTVNFYNFHPTPEETPHNSAQAVLFLVTKDGRVGFDINDCSDYFPRKEVWLGDLRYGIFADLGSISSRKDFIRFCLSKAWDEKKLQRDCRLCKHLDGIGEDDGFNFWRADCSLFDERVPSGTTSDRAINCPCFELDLNNAGLGDVFQEFDTYWEYRPEIDNQFHECCDSFVGDDLLTDVADRMLYEPSSYSEEQKQYIDFIFELFDEEGNVRLPRQYVTQAFALAEKRKRRIVTGIASPPKNNKSGHWRGYGFEIELKLKEKESKSSI